MLEFTDLGGAVILQLFRSHVAQSFGCRHAVILQLFWCHLGVVLQLFCSHTADILIILQSFGSRVEVNYSVIIGLPLCNHRVGLVLF